MHPLFTVLYNRMTAYATAFTAEVIIYYIYISNSSTNDTHTLISVIIKRIRPNVSVLTNSTKSLLLIDLLYPLTLLS